MHGFGHFPVKTSFLNPYQLNLPFETATKANESSDAQSYILFDSLHAQKRTGPCVQEPVFFKRRFYPKRHPSPEDQFGLLLFQVAAYRVR